MKRLSKVLTDKLLQEFANAFSKKDKITGLRTLNITNDEVSKQKSQMMMNEIINEAKSKGIRVLQSGDVDFERAKKIITRVVGGSHYKDSDGLRFAVIDFNDFNASKRIVNHLEKLG